MSKILVHVWWSKWFIVRKSSLYFDRENNGSERDWKKQDTFCVTKKIWFLFEKKCGPKWREQLVVWTNTLHILVRGNVEQCQYGSTWTDGLPACPWIASFAEPTKWNGILNRSPFALSLHRQGLITQGVRSQILKVWKCEFRSCPDFALIWLSVQKTVYLVDLPTSYPYLFVHMTVLAVFHHSLL